MFLSIYPVTSLEGKKQAAVYGIQGEKRRRDETRIRTKENKI